MGRKNLTAERTEMILDAFERCIVRYGLDGASLENVAAEVGFRRGLVRHYLGNRDDMVDALARRAVTRYHVLVDDMMALLPEQSPDEVLLDLLFPPEAATSQTDLSVMEQLILAGGRYPTIKALMTEWLDGFVTKLADRLVEAYPGTDPQQCWSVAYGLISIYFNQESLGPLELAGRYRDAARYSAAGLLASLH